MMDHEAIVNALRCATEDVFSTMLGLEVMSGEAYKETNAPGPSDGMIGVIGLAGAWVGTASMCSTAVTGCLMASHMLGMEFTEVNDDVLDAVSEITNMIFGNFKTVAETYLGPLGLSIPTVFHGFNFSSRTPGKEEWTVVPFACGGQTLQVKVCLTPNRGLPHLATMGSERLAQLTNG